MNAKREELMNTLLSVASELCDAIDCEAVAAVQGG